MPHAPLTTDHRAPDGRPDYLVRLGVMLPCSPDDVEQAYLEKVKRAHPDRGGSQQDFLALQEAYARAKEYAKFQVSRRRWLGESIERYARQQELIAELAELGGQVKVVQLDWLAGEIGEDFAQVLESIEGISASGPKFNDKIIDLLLRYADVLTQLHQLDLSGSRVTDEGVARLAEFTSLRKLDLTGTPVGNAGFKACANLPRLGRLAVAGSRVTRFGRFWMRVARPDLEIARTRAGATRGFRGHVPLLAAVSILYVIGMAAATHVPLDGVTLPIWPIPIDKVFHFTAYAGLAFLLATLAAAIWTGTGGRWWGHLLRYAAVLPLVALYGVLDEVTQPIVGRTADPTDYAADLAGAATGLVAFFVVRVALKRLAERRWAHLAAQRLAPLG